MVWSDQHFLHFGLLIWKCHLWILPLFTSALRILKNYLVYNFKIKGRKRKRKSIMDTQHVVHNHVIFFWTTGWVPAPTHKSHWTQITPTKTHYFKSFAQNALYHHSFLFWRLILPLPKVWLPDRLKHFQLRVIYLHISKATYKWGTIFLPKDILAWTPGTFGIKPANFRLKDDHSTSWITAERTFLNIPLPAMKRGAEWNNRWMSDAFAARRKMTETTRVNLPTHILLFLPWGKGKIRVENHFVLFLFTLPKV